MPEGDHRPGRSIAVALARAAHSTAAWISSLLKVDPSVGRERLTEEHLRQLVAANTHLDKDERRIIDDVLGSNSSMIREVMVPRTEVVFLDVAMAGDEALAVARDSLHSRFPLIDGSSDNIVGFVHVRDMLLTLPDPVRVTKLVREVKRLPGSKRVLPALSEMRREGHHLAVVIDEYGGTAGIVTLEDLIEELVGEIHDEYDDEPELAAEGVLPTDVDGRLNLADFADRAGFELPDGPYETLGGFLMAALGHLPQVGDCVEESGVALTVLALDGRRVSRVGLEPLPESVATPAVMPSPDASELPVPQPALVQPRHHARVAARGGAPVPAVEPAE